MCYIYEYKFQSTRQPLTPLNPWYGFYKYADINEVATIILGFLKKIFT